MTDPRLTPRFSNAYVESVRQNGGTSSRIAVAVPPEHCVVGVALAKTKNMLG